MVLIGKKLMGMLVVDNLLLGKMLWMLLMGMGFVLFMLIICDLDIYDCFDKVILIYMCCLKGEFVYMDYIKYDLLGYEYLGDIIKEKFVYYLIVMCEVFDNEGWIIDLIVMGKLFMDFGVLVFLLENDCVMLCGSIVMLKDMIDLLK